MPTGRPTSYKPEYCEQIIEFFDIPHAKQVLYKEHFDKEGNVMSREYKVFPNTIPFFAAFARKIGVWVETTLKWCEKHVEFNQAYQHCKHLQREMLITNGLNGLYNSTAYVFTAKNIAGMRDQIEQVQGISGELVDLLKEMNGTGRGLPQYPKQIDSVVKMPVIESVKAKQTTMSDMITPGKGE